MKWWTWEIKSHTNISWWDPEFQKSRCVCNLDQYLPICLGTPSWWWRAGLTVPNIVVLIRSTNVATDTRNSQPHIVRSSNIHICSNKQRRTISTHQDLKLTNTRYSHMISFRVQKSTGCASISSINRLDTTKITHRSSAHGNMKQMFFQKTDVQISATYA